MSRADCAFADCDGTEPTCSDRHGGECPFKPATVCVRLDGLADQIARYLVREQSNGLCDENYPNPCDGCDCFDGSMIRYAQAQAAGIVSLLQSLAVQ